MVKVRDLADKQTVALEELEAFVDQELQAMTPRLLAAAKERNKDNEYTNIDTLDELKAHIETCKQEDKVTGFVLIGWDGSEETEAKIKEETGFTTRNIPFEAPMEKQSILSWQTCQTHRLDRPRILIKRSSQMEKAASFLINKSMKENLSGVMLPKYF